MKRVELTYDLDLGSFGLKIAKVLARVEGMRVELLAVTVGDDENGNILHMLNFATVQDIKIRIREKFGQADCEYDWDPRELA